MELLLCTGIILAYCVGKREAVRRGLPEDFFADLFIWAMPISIFSARLYYVIMKWDYYGVIQGKLLKFGMAELRFMAH